MSLDGFIAGPDDDMDWLSRHGEMSPMGSETMERIGAILAGRRWYELATERWDGPGGIYGGRWDGQVFVLTHRDAPDDPAVTFTSAPLEEAVAAGLEAADGKTLEIFGATIANQCLDAGLLDEIVVHIAPVLLGDGVPFAAGVGREVALEPVDVGRGERSVDIRYRVARR